MAIVSDTKEMRVRGVVFLDAAGTLTLPLSSLVRGALTGFGVDPDPADQEYAWDAGVRAMDRAHGSDAEPSDVFWTAYVITLGIADHAAGAAAESVQTAIAKSSLPFATVRSGAKEGLELLARLNVLCAIVSNAFGTVEQELAEMNLCQVGPGPGLELGAVLDSGVVGASKPDQAIFDLARSSLGVTADTPVVHVGDSVRTDVEGATNAGLLGLHFDPHQLCDDREHGHLEALSDLKQWLT